MNDELRDIVAAAVCRFNVEIDRNEMAASISDRKCDATCDYCRLQAEYIVTQIEEQKNGKKQSLGDYCPAHREA